MRLLRLDGAGPGGEDLEFHPRLTVLADAPASVVARLTALLQVLGGAAGGDPGARVAVGGVSFPAEEANLAALRTSVRAGAGPGAATLPPGGPVDLVVDLSAFAGPRRATPAMVGDRGRVAELAEAEAAVELLEREVAGRVRSLDAFAAAAREAARRRVEAARQEAGGSGAAAAGPDDPERSAAIAEDAELEARIAELELLRDSLADAVGPGADPAAAAALGEALVAVEAATGRPPGTDPAAAALADRLEDSLAAAVRRRARRRAMAQLADAVTGLMGATRRELHAAERAAATTAERAPVRARLDAVRARIVELAEAGPEPEAREELSELRAEEAELLDALGADTYAELVVRPPDPPGGSPEVLRARLELLEQESVAVQRRLEGAEREERRSASTRDGLVGEAAALLGAQPGDVARLTRDELAALLRGRPDRAGHDAAVAAAAAALRGALAAVGAPTGADDPATLVATARDWQEGDARRRARAVAAAERRAEVDAELAGLRSRMAASPSARMRAELAEAEADLARADARAERAAEAEAELAALRAELDAARSDLADRRIRRRDEDRLDAAVADATPDPSTVTWAVLQRIASVRRAAPDGGMPLLLTGLDAALAPAVLTAVADVLDEVQLVVAGGSDLAGRIDLAGGSDPAGPVPSGTTAAWVHRWP